MNKQSFTMLLHFLISAVLCFVLIWLFVFLWGWKLIESGDPILLEIVAALGMGFVFWVVYEITRSLESKVNELEKRLSDLEKKHDIGQPE